MREAASQALKSVQLEGEVEAVQRENLLFSAVFRRKFLVLFLVIGYR